MPGDIGEATDIDKFMKELEKLDNERDKGLYRVPKLKKDIGSFLGLISRRVTRDHIREVKLTARDAAVSNLREIIDRLRNERQLNAFKIDIIDPVLSTEDG